MLSKAVSFILLSLSTSILAIPAAPIAEAPSPASAASTAATTFVSNFPICGTLGFTQEPGDHDFATLEGEELTLETCREACIRNGTCQAVSYAQIYSLCSFYSEPMECDQLFADDSSYFAHYDNACPFPRNDEGEQSSS